MSNDNAPREAHSDQLWTVLTLAACVLAGLAVGAYARGELSRRLGQSEPVAGFVWLLIVTVVAGILWSLITNALATYRRGQPLGRAAYGLGFTVAALLGWWFRPVSD